MPASPSTSITLAVGDRREAAPAPTTAGMPYSRATTAQWLRTPPVSVTTAATVANSGVHGGAVVSATRMSPGLQAPGVGDRADDPGGAADAAGRAGRAAQLALGLRRGGRRAEELRHEPAEGVVRRRRRGASCPSTAGGCSAAWRSIVAARRATTARRSAPGSASGVAQLLGEEHEHVLGGGHGAVGARRRAAPRAAPARKWWIVMLSIQKLWSSVRTDGRLRGRRACASNWPTTAAG